MMENNKKLSLKELEESFEYWHKYCIKHHKELAERGFRVDGAKMLPSAVDDDISNFFFNAQTFPYTGKDNILFDEENWQQFWKLCKKYFPKESVNWCNTYQESMDEELHRFQVILRTLKIELDKTEPFLEIGCGNGGVGIQILSEGYDYYAIDYALTNPSLQFYPNNFIEIQTSGIPSNLASKDFGFVFSSNVFQHLTKKQRLDYFKQVYDCLKHGGKFYFDVFMWNFSNPKFGSTPRDLFSTKFFGVETSIETYNEIVQLLENIGFIIEQTCHPFATIKEENYPMGFLCLKS